MDIGHWKLTAAITAGCLSGALATHIFIRRFAGAKDATKPQKWIRVGRVKKLIIYPIKSCQGVELPEVTATPIGFKASDHLRDRIFLVVDYRYTFQTQRALPTMALIHVSIQGDTLSVEAPGMALLTITIPENILKNKRTCRVWDDHVREVLDCGDEIGKWLDTFLNGSGYRLVYHALDKTQRKLQPYQEKFPGFMPNHKGSFQDQTSYMLMVDESITELNTKLDKQVTYRNFRPSILIDGIPEPYCEDFWSFVRVGYENGPIFKTSKPCTRCRLTTVDPHTGEFDEKGEPLKTLLEMKRSFGNDIVDKLVEEQGVIGIQLGLSEEGCPIKVGDPVYAALL